MARKRKRNVFSEKKDKIIEVIKTVFKKCFPFLLVLLILLVLGFALRNYIMRIKYFRVKSIVIVNNTGQSRDISFLKTIKETENIKGENIFKVNIKWLEYQLNKNYPQIKNIVVKRVLPDRIELMVDQRVPLASINAFGQYAIDNDSTVLVYDQATMSDLPLITGFKIWTKPSIGEKISSDRVELAKSVLSIFYNVPEIKKHGIKSIDVSNPKNLIVQLNGPIEIRMGQQDFSEKIKKLQFILQDKNIDVKGLEYIDLRFEDPVLGPRK
ncbi:MAG: cell division protein FtsQ/DivIB [Candidatus Omnitrophica bacterium]|nr:cell division protein FtsQ/DivIB [Candidatus Omnitrophota bacterium]